MMQVIAQRLTVVWLAEYKLWCKLWIQLLVGFTKGKNVDRRYSSLNLVEPDAPSSRRLRVARLEDATSADARGRGRRSHFD